MRSLLTILILLFMAVANAEVTAKGETGFNLRIEGTTDVPPDKAYEQFLRINEWWVASHTWFGSANNLRIDAQAGGCFCEIDGDKQVQHMQVTFVNPGKEVKMIGGLGPLQMMGLHGGMSWQFQETDNGTKIVQTYNVTGWAPGGLLDLADIVDAVQTQQLNALISVLNAE